MTEERELREALAEVEELLDERDILADENAKMAEYLLYLHDANKIDLVRDEFDWLIINDK